MKLNISLVPYGLLSASLAKLGKYLEIAAKLTAGRCCVDDLVRLFITGQFSLWVVYDTEGNDLYGFFALEVKQYPQRKLLCIQHCVIEPNHMSALEQRMEDIATRYAKDNGCSGVEFVGRPGWRKYAKRGKYHSQSVVYQRFFDEVAS